MNVRIFILILASLLVQGCSSLIPKFGFGKEPEVKEIKTICEPEKKLPLNLEDPEHLDLSSIGTDWKVLADNNVAYFCLNKDGYQSLAILLVELRERIEAQRKLTQMYRDYYEAEEEETEDDTK